MVNQVKSITQKSKDISGWYNDVIERAQLAEHGPVKRTIILRPRGYALWEASSTSITKGKIFSEYPVVEVDQTRSI